MLNLNFDYASCVRNSEKISWRLDEVMPESSKLDFSRPFLPNELADSRSLSSLLTDDERRALNQISGNAYLNLFSFVEEYILATMAKHAQAEIFGDPHALRALVRFVDEELKHQALFDRFRRAFIRDFGYECGVLETAVQVAGVIMSHSPAAVLIITLHIELMTQQHYTECVKDSKQVDPLFQSLLKHHWLEESQHARIDALELAKLGRVLASDDIDHACDEYLGILEAFDGLLAEQSKLDLDSFARVVGRTLSETEAKRITQVQLAGYRKTFLWYGMTNPTFVEYIQQLSAAKAGVIAERARQLVTHVA